VKFYLDADLSRKIAELLRRRGFDAVSAFEVQKAQSSDQEQLDLASREGRCFVTRNARDFIDLSEQAVRRHAPHAGIILCPPSIRGYEFGAIADALVRVANLYPGGLGGYDVVYLGGPPELSP
jgi:predicted nuclease of predicted toxin-antitoxin system